METCSHIGISRATSCANGSYDFRVHCCITPSALWTSECSRTLHMWLGESFSRSRKLLPRLLITTSIRNGSESSSSEAGTLWPR